MGESAGRLCPTFTPCIIYVDMMESIKDRALGAPTARAPRARLAGETGPDPGPAARTPALPTRRPPASLRQLSAAISRAHRAYQQGGPARAGPGRPYRRRHTTGRGQTGAPGRLPPSLAGARYCCRILSWLKSGVVQNGRMTPPNGRTSFHLLVFSFLSCPPFTLPVPLAC